MSKVCSRCGEPLPDGCPNRQQYHKSCRDELDKERRAEKYKAKDSRELQQARSLSYYHRMKSDPDWKKKESRRDTNRKRKQKYQMRDGEYDAMLVAQNHRCAICNTHISEAPRGLLCVDHDHEILEEYEPGQYRLKIRGLLCGTCNSALGLAKESPTVLYRMAAYVIKHQQSELKLVA